MRTVAVIQARMGSSRLPGKVLQDIGSGPMLGCVVSRLRRSRTLDDIAVATSTSRKDDPIAKYCADKNITCIRDSEHDVLARYVAAQRTLQADVLVRITADCPLIDPGVVDRVVLRAAGVDYASNTMERSFPRGLDTEAFSADCLDRIDRIGTTPEEREHVTLAVHLHPDSFRRASCRDPQDNSHLRWTVDTESDMKMVRALWRDLDLDRNPRSYREIIAHLRAFPEVSEINRHVEQKQIFG